MEEKKEEVEEMDVENGEGRKAKNWRYIKRN